MTKWTLKSIADNRHVHIPTGYSCFYTLEEIEEFIKGIGAI